MMATARHVPAACASIKAGKWERSKFVGIELKGKTLAIVGLGKGIISILPEPKRWRHANRCTVGLTVAKIARGFGMTVVAYDPYANTSIAAAQNIALYTDLHACVALGDFVTIHTPLMPATRGMIGTKELAAMKSTATILNVGRGG